MHPVSVLMGPLTQHEGDLGLFRRSIGWGLVSSGAEPFGTFSVASHPAATPGRDTLS